MGSVEVSSAMSDFVSVDINVTKGRVNQTNRGGRIDGSSGKTPETTTSWATANVSSWRAGR